MQISIYHNYTPQELRDALMETEDGNAKQLHNAAIVLCEIAKAQQTIIAAHEKIINALTKAIGELEHPQAGLPF